MKAKALTFCLLLLSLGAGSVWALAHPTRGATRPLAQQPDTEPSYCPSTWRAERYARRAGGVSFALNCDGKISGFGTWRRSYSASTGKALLLVSYLRSGRAPGSNSSDLKSMIHVSDNEAATRIYNQLGDRPLRKTLKRAGMKKTRLCGCWASIQWSPADYSRLFASLPESLPRKRRWWAMSLLGGVTPSQQWGIPRQSKRRGWRTYIKGGWREQGQGWIVLQGALLRRGDKEMSLAVFTRNQSGVEAGARKIEMVSKLLLKRAALRQTGVN